MKTSTFVCLYGFAVCFLLANGGVHADCGDEASKGSEEGGVTSFFKNLGCNIKKGAEDLQESAKPYTDKISSSAKEFGNTVVHKYGEIKHKLTDDETISSTSAKPIINAPTEKVPLAPLSGDTPAPMLNSNTPEANSETQTPSSSNPETPMSIDDRFLLQLNECPAGQTRDHQHHCRPTI